MIDSDLVSNLPGLKHMRRWNAGVEQRTAILLLMAPGYFAELGFYAVVLIIIMRRMKELDGDTERTAIFLVLNGLVVSTFVRSTVIGMNDFGIRSMLVPQFFLLLLASLLLDGTIKISRHSVKWLLGVTMAVGLVGTVYQAVLLRLFLPVEDRLHRQNFAGLAERNMALREAMHDFEEHTPMMTVVQYDTQQAEHIFQLCAVDEHTTAGGECYAGLQCCVSGAILVSARGSRLSWLGYIWSRRGMFPV